jgi:16S rRNA processing protein RimM
MNYIYVGKIVNTHALKGEVRLISNFDFKSRIFKKDNVVYVGENKDKLVIETYRTHKQFDMLKFVGIDYINDVLKYKGCNVYIDEDSLKLNDNEILTSDLVNYDVYSNDKLIGRISEYRFDN